MNMIKRRSHGEFMMSRMVAIVVIIVAAAISAYLIWPVNSAPLQANSTEESVTKSKSFIVTIPKPVPGTCQANCQQKYSGSWSADFEKCMRSCGGHYDDEIREVVVLTKTEDPGYDAMMECRNIVEKKYVGEPCALTLGPQKDSPRGSTWECVIACKTSGAPTGQAPK
jgi:hypothetical protein